MAGGSRERVVASERGGRTWRDPRAQGSKTTRSRDPEIPIPRDAEGKRATKRVVVREPPKYRTREVMLHRPPPNQYGRVMTPLSSFVLLQVHGRRRRGAWAWVLCLGGKRLALEVLGPRARRDGLSSISKVVDIFPPQSKRLAISIPLH